MPSIDDAVTDDLPGADRSGPADSLLRAFRHSEREGFALALRLRLIATSALAVLVLARAPWPSAAYYLGLLVAFSLLGVLQYRLVRRGRMGRRAGAYAFALLDVLLLTYALIMPNPLVSESWPMAMQLRLGNFDYLYVFLALTVLGYSPGLALWTGAIMAVTWSGGVLWILSQPESFTASGVEMLATLSLDELLGRILDPHYVSLEIWIQHAALILITAAILAAAVQRSRRLAFRQARLARERANLARYFSPNLVENLAGTGGGLETVKNQNAAVMFVDIVGFTALCETLPPDRAIALLQGFYGRMARAVFAHGGTLNKYIGDSVMASFGAPEAGQDDAARALRCALQALDEVADWNDKRRERGHAPVRVGIGLHYGPVVTGDAGDARCLEYAVIGDTVNIAKRLEGLTRGLGSPLAISQELIDRAVAEGAADSDILAWLRSVAPQALRGRSAPIHLQVLADPPVQA